MARRKAAPKKGKKADPSKANHVTITFKGGPRDGDTMHVCNPPNAFMRLAMPEWANYFRIGDSLDFEYDMEREPIMHRYDFRNYDKDKT